MPMIDIKLPKGALDEQTRATLADRLTTTLLKWEKAPDTEFFRAISWTHVHELAADATHDANGPDAPPHFLLDVTTPQGALSDRRREEMTKEMTQQVLEAAGLAPEDGMRVWIIMHEVPEGSWGAGGAVIRFEQLRAAAQQQREEAGAPTG